MLLKLSRLKVGQHAVVRSVSGEGALRLRLLELGFTPGTSLVLQKRAPFGDPLQIRLRGFDLTLRAADAAWIAVETEARW